MTQKPDVDWSAINWSAMVIHKTTAREDNMRAVQDQLGGSAPEPLGGQEATDCHRRLTQGTPAPPPPWQPGVGQALYSQQEIDGYRQASIALAKQALDKVIAANEELMRACGVDRRYLEGDTEFSDQDVEHYYRTKAT